MATVLFAPPSVLIPDGPGVRGVAVTKSDTTVYDPPLRKIWVGGAGDVAVLFIGDTVAVTLSAVPAGTMLDACVTKVMSTNTTATLITGLS